MILHAALENAMVLALYAAAPAPPLSDADFSSPSAVRTVGAVDWRFGNSRTTIGPRSRAARVVLDPPVPANRIFNVPRFDTTMRVQAQGLPGELEALMDIVAAAFPDSGFELTFYRDAAAAETARVVATQPSLQRGTSPGSPGAVFDAFVQTTAVELV